MALVPLDAAEEFVKSVKASFYIDKVSVPNDIDDLIFVTKPDTGATVFNTSILKDA